MMAADPQIPDAAGSGVRSRSSLHTGLKAVIGRQNDPLSPAFPQPCPLPIIYLLPDDVLEVGFTHDYSACAYSAFWQARA